MAAQERLIRSYRPASQAVIERLAAEVRSALDMFARRLIDSTTCGDALEAFVHEVLASTSGVFRPHGSMRTPTSQIDNVCDMNPPHGSFLERWGAHALVECKHWATRVGKSHGDEFVSMMVRAEAR